MSIYVKCVNCGKQNAVDDNDPFDVKCLFGNHKVRIKREGNIMTGSMPEIIKSESESANGSEISVTATSKPELPPVHSDALRCDSVEHESERVPPRPDVSGKTLGERLKLSHDYYEANKPAILHDLEVLSENEMLKRWGISQSTWGTGKIRCGIRNRWLPERYGEFISHSRKKKLAKAAVAPAPEIKKMKRQYKRKAPVKAAEDINIVESARDNTSDRGNQVKRFPDFNEQWSDDIKKKWLEIFLELYRIDWGREAKGKSWLKRIFRRD